MAAKYGVYQGTVQDGSGNGVASATLTVRDAAAQLIQLYADRDGVDTLGNPFLAEDDGSFKFYARPGRIEVTAQDGSLIRVASDEIIIDDYYQATTVTEAGTARTLDLEDNNATIVCTSGSAVSITIPPVADVEWPDSATVYAHQSGAGQVTFVAGAGVTLRYPESIEPRTSGQYATIAARMVAEDVWAIVGQTEVAAE
jgi:hypothetical protein